MFISRLLFLSLILMAPFISFAEVPEADIPRVDVTSETTTLPADTYQPDPLGQRIAPMEVFSTRRGYVHPFLSVSEFYTDNLFNTPDEEESDFITILSPGIWVSLPASRQQLIDIETMNTSPGGLGVRAFRTPPKRRLQGYALYRADLRKNKDFEEEDTTTHRAEGLGYFRFRGGLSFELFDIYENNHDSYATGTNQRQRDDFSSNLVNFTSVYPYSPKLNLEVGYSFYDLSYDAVRNNFRDRQDHSVNTFLRYRFLPKTSFLLGYDHLNINYDQNINEDSSENHVLTGFLWIPNSRSQARILLGYGRKNFDDGLETQEDFIGEMQFNLVLSPKTSLYLRGIRQTNETDIETAQDILVNRAQVRYLQKLAPRINGTVQLQYAQEDYRGDRRFESTLGARSDDYYSGSLSLGYAFRRWLHLSGGYTYTERASNYDSYDYVNNSIYLTLTAAM